jgi:DNA (cytosine-5)-methyltransferase 1
MGGAVAGQLAIAQRESYRARPDGILERLVELPGRCTLSRMRDISGLRDSVEPWMRWWRSYLRGSVVEVAECGAPVRIVDLFSGIGGLSLGAAEAVRAVGMTPVFELAVDMDAAALEVYAENLRPSAVLARDLGCLLCRAPARLPDGDLPDRSWLADPLVRSLVGRVDLLLAGPPCEGHSNLNNHTRRRDLRNLLMLDAVALAIALEASAVVIENVATARLDAYGVVGRSVRTLESAGYRVRCLQVDASRYGVAQTRQRLFILASRYGTPSEWTLRGLEKLPVPDVRWAIEDIEDADGSFLDIPARLSPENERRIAYLFETGSYELPNHLRPRCHRNGHTYPSMYGRLSWDRPAGTITTGFMSAGRGRYVHPSRPRTLTPHEAARLQGIPDSFRLVRADGGAPSRTQLAKWIGNAVPPPLAYAVVLTVLEASVGHRS